MTDLSSQLNGLSLTQGGVPDHGVRKVSCPVRRLLSDSHALTPTPLAGSLPAVLSPVKLCQIANRKLAVLSTPSTSLSRLRPLTAARLRIARLVLRALRLFAFSRQRHLRPAFLTVVAPDSALADRARGVSQLRLAFAHVWPSAPTRVGGWVRTRPAPTAVPRVSASAYAVVWRRCQRLPESGIEWRQQRYRPRTHELDDVLALGGGPGTSRAAAGVDVSGAWDAEQGATGLCGTAAGRWDALWRLRSVAGPRTGRPATRPFPPSRSPSWPARRRRGRRGDPDRDRYQVDSVLVSQGSLARRDGGARAARGSSLPSPVCSGGASNADSCPPSCTDSLLLSTTT